MKQDWRVTTLNIPPSIDAMIEKRATELGIDRSTYFRRLIAADVAQNSQDVEQLNLVSSLLFERKWMVPRCLRGAADSHVVVANLEPVIEFGHKQRLLRAQHWMQHALDRTPKRTSSTVGGALRYANTHYQLRAGAAIRLDAGDVDIQYLKMKSPGLETLIVYNGQVLLTSLDDFIAAEPELNINVKDSNDTITD